MIGSHRSTNDYQFQRTQSASLRTREWESRISPLGSYGIEVLRLLGIAALGCAVLVILLAVV